eukprot:30220-Chlamydomonas_euryale.AAC.1
MKRLLAEDEVGWLASCRLFKVVQELLFLCGGKGGWRGAGEGEALRAKVWTSCLQFASTDTQEPQKTDIHTSGRPISRTCARAAASAGSVYFMTADDAANTGPSFTPNGADGPPAAPA